jgi:hypothetical protein
VLRTIQLSGPTSINNAEVFWILMDSTYTWWIPWAVGIATGCFFWFYVRPRNRRK